MPSERELICRALLLSSSQDQRTRKLRRGNRGIVEQRPRGCGVLCLKAGEVDCNCNELVAMEVEEKKNAPWPCSPGAFRARAGRWAMGVGERATALYKKAHTVPSNQSLGTSAARYYYQMGCRTSSQRVRQRLSGDDCRIVRRAVGNADRRSLPAQVALEPDSENRTDVGCPGWDWGSVDSSELVKNSESARGMPGCASTRRSAVLSRDRSVNQ